MSHVPPWCESILGLKVEAVLGKQVSLEWTEKSGGLWEWGLILEFLSPSSGERLLLRCDGNARNSFPTTQGRIPPLELAGGNGATLEVRGTLVFLLSGDGYVAELLELQQGCEGPFGSSRG